MTIGEVEKQYGAKFPATLAARYSKEDGEKKSPAPWRFNSLAEISSCGMDGMLEHGEGEYVLTLGPLLPILTDDQSNLLALQASGPLEGYLLHLSHDSGDIYVAFRSIDSFLAARDEERYKNAKGAMGWFDFTDKSKATDADKKAAERLTAFHKATDDLNAECGESFYTRTTEDLTR